MYVVIVIYTSFSYRGCFQRALYNARVCSPYTLALVADLVPRLECNNMARRERCRRRYPPSQHYVTRTCIVRAIHKNLGRPIFRVPTVSFTDSKLGGGGGGGDDGKRFKTERLSAKTDRSLDESNSYRNVVKERKKMFIEQNMNVRLTFPYSAARCATHYNNGVI